MKTKFHTKTKIPDNFFSQIYWLGDLNYRITEMEATIAKNHILLDDLEPVLALDQLVQQRRLGKVLQGYHEAEIKFKPTYKYDPGTDNWDSRYARFYIFMQPPHIFKITFD